jgi:hypothetical protein
LLVEVVEALVLLQTCLLVEVVDQVVIDTLQDVYLKEVLFQL